MENFFTETEQKQILTNTVVRPKMDAREMKTILLVNHVFLFDGIGGIGKSVLINRWQNRKTDTPYTLMEGDRIVTNPNFRYWHGGSTMLTVIANKFCDDFIAFALKKRKQPVIVLMVLPGWLIHVSWAHLLPIPEHLATTQYYRQIRNHIVLRKTKKFWRELDIVKRPEHTAYLLVNPVICILYLSKLFNRYKHRPIILCSMTPKTISRIYQEIVIPAKRYQIQWHILMPFHVQPKATDQLISEKELKKTSKNLILTNDIKTTFMQSYCDRFRLTIAILKSTVRGKSIEDGWNNVKDRRPCKTVFPRPAWFTE